MWLPDATLTAGESWLVLGVSVGKTALTVLASWLMRLKIDGSALPAHARTRQPDKMRPRQRARTLGWVR